MERTDSSYNFLYLKYRLTHQLVFRRTQMCAVKDQFTLIPLAGKLDKGGGGGVPRLFPGMFWMFSSSPPRGDARDPMCGESAPLIFPCSARSLLSARSPAGAGKMGSSSSGSPFGQTTVHLPPTPHPGRTVFTVFIDR